MANSGTWGVGMILDLEPWGGSKIRIKKPKPKKTVKKIRVAISALANESRDVANHRNRIEKMAEMYDEGFDPLTGEKIEDIPSYEFFGEDADGNLYLLPEKDIKKIDEVKKAKKPRTDKEWRNTRGGTHNNEREMKMLEMIFKAHHDIMNNEDEE